MSDQTTSRARRACAAEAADIGQETDMQLSKRAWRHRLAAGSIVLALAGMAVGKEFAWGMHRFSVRADVLNVLNTINYGGYDDFAGAPLWATRPTSSAATT
jgi:hypothetical protein